MNKRIYTGIGDVLLYFVMFFVIQFFSMCVFKLFISDLNAVMVYTTLLSSVATVGVYYLLKWVNGISAFLYAGEAKALLWVVLLSIGLLFPSQWLSDVMGIEADEDLEFMFKNIMNHPMGILSVSVLVPIAEEVVFRGAVLRRLLEFVNRPVYAIVLSALAFAVAHGNIAQGWHAFLLGILLGWLFYRTKSILPGIVFHLVNNLSAVVITLSCPDEESEHLIDVFGGDEVSMYAAVVTSFVIAAYSLWRLVKTL